MTSAPPPPDPARAARSNALQLLLGLGLLGNQVTERLVHAVGDPELVRNLPVGVVADLWVSGSRRPAEIQQRSGLTSGGVTKLLDRLEVQGLVLRAFGQVPGDRRAIVVTLTPRGEEVARQLADSILGYTDEVRAAIHGLQELLDAIEADRPVEP